jgi:hypothetical protein
MVEIWLKTDFEGGRHARRLEKIALYESQTGVGTATPSGTSPSAAPPNNAG